MNGKRGVTSITAFSFEDAPQIGAGFFTVKIKMYNHKPTYL